MRRRACVTYVRMPPDLLDGLLIEMPGVAQEALADLVCVLQPVEDIVNQQLLAALLQISTLRLAERVHLLEPGLVGRG